MAWVITVCLKCRKTISKEWSDHWKKDMKSHGLCAACYEKDNR